jgi:hypothetical protein
MVERYRKGKRTYTQWDKKTEQVTVPSKIKRTAQDIAIEVPLQLGNGKTANLFIVQHREEEFIVDFCFLPSGTAKARLVERVIMNPRQTKMLLVRLEKAIQ